MKRYGCTVGRSVVETAAAALSSARRAFVDAPAGDAGGNIGMDVPVYAGSPLDVANTAEGAAIGYEHPLVSADTTYKLYGEQANFANDAANRIFSTGRLHSYDPSVLYSDLRLQEAQPATTNIPGTEAAHANATNVAGSSSAADQQAAAAKAAEVDDDAVMREGRDKQGAAGAAAVAAAMLEARPRTEGGIALVPGHPLPVVFPRPDGLPPPLRFVKKFGPGQTNQTRSRQRLRQHKGDTGDFDELMYGEVMTSESKVEGHSIKRSIAMQVRVLDEHKRFSKVRQFQHFSEVSEALPERVMMGLENCGFAVPTLVQSAAIPELMAGKDVVGVAPNGSGKSIAYSVPSLAVLLKVMAKGDPRPSHDAGVAQPLVLVLCPSRETVQRTAATYSGLIGEETHVVSVYKTVKDNEKQEQFLAEGCEVLVATPARLQELRKAGKVVLDCVHFVAVDEADKIFTQGRGAELTEAMDLVRRNSAAHQVSIWSSIMTPEVDDLTKRYASPQMCTVLVSREEETNINVTQILYPMKSRDERLALVQMLYDRRAILKREQVVVFCLYKETAEAVAKELATMLSAPSSLVRYVHSGLRTRKRNQVLQDFKHGDVRVLVATDIGARRLDVPDLEHVINYDLPPTTEAFVRRLSQVGRAGRKGTVHTFLCPNDARVPMIARFVEQQTGHALSEDIQKMVDGIVQSGGEDDWTTPLIRFSDHAATASKWHIRGRRHSNYKYSKAASAHTTESDVPQSKPTPTSDSAAAPPKE